MLTYRRIDLSEHFDAPKPIIYYVTVTPKNTTMVKNAVPRDQFKRIEVGDEMSVYAINSSVANSPRRFTIWYNKEMAAIETSEGSIWGDWDEEEKLLLTEVFQEAQDVYGYSVGGRIAHNLLGHSGIYSSGKFYLLTEATSET
jgi:hypothetical protein